MYNYKTGNNNVCDVCFNCIFIQNLCVISKIIINIVAQAKHSSLRTVNTTQYPR